MTQTPLSQEAAATKPVAAGLHKAGPQPQTFGLNLVYHPSQRLGLTAGAFLRAGFLGNTLDQCNR
jgi:hypothetical protein